MDPLFPVSASRSGNSLHSIELISNLVGEFLWEVDASGRYTFVNSTAQVLTGYQPEELIGRYYWEFLAESNRESVVATAGTLFAQRAELHSLLNEIVTKDGRHVTVLTNAVPILGPNNELLGYRGSDRDVTGVFQVLKTAEQFKSVMDRANFGIALADANGILTYANAAFAQDHGFEPQEIIGHPISFLHTPQQMIQVQSLVEKIHTEGSFRGEEVWHRRKDGTEFPMLMTGILLSHPDGSSSIAATALDITQRKALESQLIEAKEQAEESGRIKAEFLSMISHEFRTPLNHILGFSSLIAESVSDPEVASFSTMIQQSANEFLRLVDDLIEIANDETKTVQARQDVFSLRELIRSVQSSLSALLRTSGKESSVRILPFDADKLSHDWRLGDIPRIRLLLEPLLKNAVKFTAQGTIGLRCEEPKPGQVRFLLSDTGCGIAPEMAAKIFDPFFQAETGLARTHGGMGIGLPLARKIAAILGGQINLWSGDSVGTTLEILLPLPEAKGTPVPLIGV